MKIAADAVVAFDYTLRNDNGDVLDTSDGEEPLTYIHGHGQIVPGLEAAMEGKSKGEAMVVVIEPKDGYGEKGAKEAVRVPRSELPDGEDPEPGMELEAVGPNGEVATLWVVGVEKDEVLLSTDHPLAGVRLHFDVKVHDVRAATKEELAHGHAHGPDGHHHH